MSIEVPTAAEHAALASRVATQDVVIADIAARLAAIEDGAPDPDTDPSPTAVVRINVGGPAVVVDGVQWEADRGYDGGAVSAQGAGRYGGAGAVYETERWSSAFGYNLTGLPVGPATVRLHWAESHPATDRPGERVFDVRAQGLLVLEAVDVVALIGTQYRSYVRQVDVEIDAAGRLGLELVGRVNAATLHGLEVYCYGTGTPTDSDPEPEPAGTWLSGAGTYDPYTFGSWRGRQVEVWETWNNFPTWGEMRGVPSVHQYFVGKGSAPFNRRFPGRLSFSQPLWAKGENAAKTASGENDDHFRTIAKALVQLGYGNAFVRVGWEHDGNWFWWRATDANTNDWVAAFRRVYGIFKAESTAFRIVWNPNKSSSDGYDVRKSYPGDNYCDVVGVDWYNMYPPNHDKKQWDAQYMQKSGAGAPVGLGAWKEFAEEHGKPLALPEWGQDWGEGNKTTHSGDDPDYIKAVHDFCRTSNVEYESTFNLGPKWNLNPTTHYPNSAALYRQLWRR